MENHPALRLTGLELKGGWKVLEIIKRPPIATGGFFSVSYKVVNKEGKEGFLKALDFSRALQTDDPARALEAMTKAYNFERDLLKTCKEKKLSKIISPLVDGNINVPGEVRGWNNVVYLIFELADGDIRVLSKLSRDLDLIWALRSLHNTAVALQQLHTHGIAHQDLKPSNVLYFQERSEFKVADLGRASCKSVPCETDNKRVPGDTGYAPFELLYGYKVENEFNRRYGVDTYHLGSLIFFYFGDVSATQAIKTNLPDDIGPSSDNNKFLSDLPYIKEAFFKSIKELESNIRLKAGDLSDDIISMIKELCEPDPSKRGHPLDRNISQYNLERYISKLDLLTKKATYMLNK